MMKEKLLEKFQDVYGDTNGTKVYFAPGRVNLIMVLRENEGTRK